MDVGLAHDGDEADEGGDAGGHDGAEAADAGFPGGIAEGAALKAEAVDAVGEDEAFVDDHAGEGNDAAHGHDAEV